MYYPEVKLVFESLYLESLSKAGLDDTPQARYHWSMAEQAFGYRNPKIPALLSKEKTVYTKILDLSVQETQFLRNFIGQVINEVDKEIQKVKPQIKYLRPEVQQRIRKGVKHDKKVLNKLAKIQTKFRQQLAAGVLPLE